MTTMRGFVSDGIFCDLYNSLCWIVIECAMVKQCTDMQCFISWKLHARHWSNTGSNNSIYSLDVLTLMIIMSDVLYSRAEECKTYIVYGHICNYLNFRKLSILT